MSSGIWPPCTPVPLVLSDEHWNCTVTLPHCSRWPVTLWAHHWGPRDSSLVLLHSRRVARTLLALGSLTLHALAWRNPSQPEAPLSGYAGSKSGTLSVSQITSALPPSRLPGAWPGGKEAQGRGPSTYLKETRRDGASRHAIIGGNVAKHKSSFLWEPSQSILS